MATLADYETALNAWLANPTPATAAAALVKRSLIASSLGADGTAVGWPDPPEALVIMAKAYTTPGPRVILARPSYGDRR